MKLKSILSTIAGLSLAVVIIAQGNQGSTSQSNSKSGNGQSSSSASGRSWGSGSSSSGGTKSGFANGGSGGSGMGFGFNGKPTHVILYALEGSSISANDKQRIFDQHAKYLSDQQTKGRVVLFGPWRDLPGSMAIVIAPSDEEAMNIARNDPAVRSGSLNFDVRAWNVVTPASSGFPGMPGGIGGLGSGGNGGGISGGGSNSGGSSGSTRGGSSGGTRGGGGTTRGGGK